MALVSCLAAGCGAGSITATEDDGSSTSTGDETSTGEPSVDLPHEPTCGDGIVDASEDCEPAGPVPCNDDCTLPADGTGALEWTFVGDVGGHAHGVAVGTGGRATVCGTLYPVSPGDPEFIAQGWIVRFEPDGAPSWQIVDAGPDDVGIHVDDVALDDGGRAIVSGSYGRPNSSAWVAAYDEAGAQLWTWIDAPPDGFDSFAPALTLLDGRVYVAFTTIREFPTDDYAHSKPNIAILAADGSLQDTRSWPPDLNVRTRSLAGDPIHEQAVIVGSSPADGWNDANWIEALDADGHTLWTAHDSVEDPPLDGVAEVLDVAIDADGGVYVSGSKVLTPDGDIYYVRKLDASGGASWVFMLPPEGVPQVAVFDGVVYAASAYFLASGPSVRGLTLRALDAATGALLWQRRVATEGAAHTNIDDLEADADSLWVVGDRRPPDDDGLWSPDDPISLPWVARFRRE